jgi:hypothetical protein
VFTLWPVMARSYEQLAAVSAAWAVNGSPAVRDLAQRLATIVAGLHASTYLATEAWRAEREAVYADMYAQSALGLAARGLAGEEGALPEQILPMLSCAHAALDRQLAERLQQRYGRADGSDSADTRALRDTLMDFLLQMQAVLRVAGEAQARLNRHLGRPAPQRLFTSDDLHLHHRLLGSEPPRLPYLMHEIESWLDARLVVDADAVQFSPQDIDAPTAVGHHPDTPGMVPGAAHANRVQPQ